MSYTFSRIGAVALRALRQLIHDPRFVGLTLVAPMVIIYFLKLFFDTLESPVFKPTQFIVPVGTFVVQFMT
jgi:ABC-2 type transport system permease protein